MMSPRLAWLALCCSLLSAAIGAPGVRAAGSPRPGAWRSSTLSVSPAPEDLALVEIGFGGRGVSTRVPRQVLSASLPLAVSAPFGDDYLAMATPDLRPTRHPVALVLLVNRPSALADPASVGLRLRTPRALGRPILLRSLDPLTHLRPGLVPALCNLPLHGASALSAPMLRPLRSLGTSLSGFAPSAAVAQAYDLSCGLPSEASFAQAVGQAGTGACRPVGALCCPPTAICASPPVAPAPGPAPAPAPSPAPPPPSPPPPVSPGCSPCDPAPGYACPLLAPAICSAVLARGERRAGAGSH